MRTERMGEQTAVPAGLQCFGIYRVKGEGLTHKALAAAFGEVQWHLQREVVAASSESLENT